MHIYGQKTTWRHNEKAAIHKPRRETKEQITPSNILVLDFQPPKQWEYELLLFKPPILWHFIMAALTNTKDISFPSGSLVKNLPDNVEDMGSIPDLERSHMLQSN